ncbi:GntR family transcriptional regulator [Neorhizobium lilium]|uniref:GntR family transcriptional regulator n=1 Tax=Neorhizobium lilium TaxID=2503024 RepID=A0A444LB29_9HYPH|nr:GntR family transcriptional regulator [Neorhizobium lilium]RWX74835.1 GntR family transcriptional regulator [Neorhizobium lilium]
MFTHHDDNIDDRGGPDRFKAMQAYSRLKNLLVAQRVPPHTKLDAGVLCRYLNVSRTPVREALIHLSIEEIILNVPGSGFFSKPLNVGDVSEDYDLALTILKHIIASDVASFPTSRLALPKPPVPASGTQAQLQPALAFKEFIERLFESVARAAANRKYLQVVHTFNARTAFVRHLDLQRAERFDEISADMCELVECLQKKDVKGAVENLDRQFRAKMDILHDLVREGNVYSANASVNWMKLLN